MTVHSPTSMATGKCPKCPNTYPLEPRSYGKKAKCNACGHVFIVAAPATGDSDHPVMPDHLDVPRQALGPDSEALSAPPMPLPMPVPVSHAPRSEQPATKRTGTGSKVVIVVAAIVAAIWWFSNTGRRQSPPPSQRNAPSYPVGQNAPSYPVGQSASRTSGQGRYSESDALQEIKAERARYAAQQKTALAADRSRKESARKLETDKNRMRLSTIRSEIQSLKMKLMFESTGKPSAPLILHESVLTRQSVLDYIEKYRKWGEERLALRRELFALQDEEAALTADDVYAGYSSPLSDLTMEISSHSITKPGEDFMSLVGDPEVRKYHRAVRAVQLEQWIAEAELLDERRDNLMADSTARRSRPVPRVAETADIATGPWRFERCVDGDTIEISVGYGGPKEKVRLLNINTPEEGQTGYYQATSALQGLLQYQTIDLEFEKPGEPTRDRYGRVLAFVFVGDTLVNFEMTKLGWTGFYTDYGRGRYALPIEFAEADAKANRRGLHR